MSPSGNYGNPPEWRRFLQQLGVWLFVVVACKLFTTLIEYVFEEPLAAFGLVVLSPLCFNPHLELFIVVVLLPLVLNAFQFWIVDEYLMAQNGAGGSPGGHVLAGLFGGLLKGGDKGKGGESLTSNFFGTKYGSTG